ncbi:MAG: C1 family peptidase [Saprospiraceae bacterium]
MRYLFLSAFLFILPAFGSTQTPADEFVSGLLIEDDTYDTQPRQAPEDGSKSDLPASVDLTPYCPEIRHQGLIFSCVGWAAGYGALSIQRAILNRCTDREVITRNAHSALFLYNQIRTEDCRKGSRISDAMKLLMERGDCLARQFDFDVNDCQQAPDSSVAINARRYAIEDYLTLFGTKEDPAVKVQRVKVVLSKNKPVVIGMMVMRNFYELKNAQYWHPAIGNTAPAGGHAMVVVGYDDRKEAFRIMNSWGKNWGDNGFIWIKYKDFGEFCKYAYTIYLVAPGKMQSADTPATQPATAPVTQPQNAQPDTQPADERPLVELAGAFQFRYLNGWHQQSNQPNFDPVDVERTFGVYRLRQREWPVGKLFQLLATTLRDDEYLYVFSIDALRAVHFHWPRQAGLNDKFGTQNESPLLLAGGGEVIIPGAKKALSLAYPGTDRLIVLFSKRKIDTVAKLAELLSRKDGDVAQNLLQLLGKHAVPAADITYAADRLAFEATTRSEGFIVPLVLEVVGQ